MESSNSNNGDISLQTNPDVVDVEEQCGCHGDYGCCGNKKRYPFKRLQSCARPQCALALLSCIGFLQGFVISGLVNVVITTIEKRFDLSSAESGMIVSSYNIASCIAIPFITYIGGRGHKPLWIGWGMGLMGVGCIVFSLPHFIAPTYEVALTDDAKSTLLCASNTTSTTDENLSYYKFVFIMAQVLNGIGTSSLYTLGMTYLDENVAQKLSSIYHGIYFSIASALGPAAGYVLGGFTLKFFTEIDQTPDITTAGSSWVGAWWLGFLISGILLILLCVPLLMFPRRMPGSKELAADRSKEMHEDKMAQSTEEDVKFGTRLKDVPKSFLVLFRNPAFMLVSLGNALDFGLISGFATFTPKYLESMYGLTPTNAAFYLGAVVIVGGSLGYIIGGLLITKAELTVKGMTKLCAISTTAAFASAFIYFLSCPDIDFAGATVPYYGRTYLSSTHFQSQCNFNCSCSRNVFEPVCGDNEITYFSSCYAGCNGKVNGTYTVCTCVQGSDSMQTARDGKCTSGNCHSLVLFLVIFFFLLFFTVLCWTPALQIVVRVVPFKQRSFAVGVQWLFNRCFGGIPVPVIFGRVLDLACAAWSGSDETEGSCRLYFNHDVARYSFYLVLSHKVITLLFYVLSTFLYKTSSDEKVEADDVTCDDVKVTGKQNKSFDEAGE